MAKSKGFKKREKKKKFNTQNSREMENKHQLTENDRRFADEFSDYVNGRMASPQKVGRALADDHRYLVNEKAKMMFCFMEQLAMNWHRGRYDQRNEWACRLSAAAIDHLAENGLYHPSDDYYENQRQ